MRKKLFVVLSVMAIAAVIGLTSSKFGVVSANPYYSVEDIKNQVSEMYPGEIMEVELEKEGKKPVYEVEVKVDGYEYELKIDGNTGQVLKLEEKQAIAKLDDDAKKEIEIEVEVDDKEENSKETDNAKNNESKEKTNTPAITDKGNENSKSENTQKNSGNNNQNHHQKQHNNCDQCDDNNKMQHHKTSHKKAVIGKDEAKRIALKQFDGTIKEIELDDDDNRLVYEIEVKRGNKEADIKIDAYTGKVLLLEIESDDDDYDDDDDKVSKGTPSMKTVISESKAKSIALQKFNGTVENIELDDDDGRLVYEIEIERGEKEAEIIIDAYTGKVLEVEIDD